ncbi:uncharacterized protein LOC111641864 [Centruroides sculpturatus]|uniref:uncharacterized protein LOC111641864 n=1 Tax=Centruroides sculpturatus TaxID=218467 RepID=UPI000C6CB9CD|nr:uncharacterized protein LOC111641864 [Centruroides sculpturatus]
MKCPYLPAFVVINNENKVYEDKIRLSDSCSVFQAELKAIEMAVEWISVNCESNKVLINTDSRSAIHALQRFQDTSLTAVNIKTTIRKYKLNIKFRWVKAHSGIVGNEIADRAAKEATHLADITYSKLPLSGVKCKRRSVTISEWQDRWTNSSKGRHTFWLLPNLEERVRDLHWIPTNHITSQVLTGHGNCNAYLQRIGKKQQ